MYEDAHFIPGITGYLDSTYTEYITLWFSKYKQRFSNILEIINPISNDLNMNHKRGSVRSISGV
jgi:hypothetical protein